MSFILDNHIVKSTCDSIAFKRDTIILILLVVWDFPNDISNKKQFY